MSSLSLPQMRCTSQAYARACRVKALPSERKAAGALVGASLAALMTLSPANAGVQLEQPKLKNAFVTDDTAAPAPAPKPLPDPVAKQAKKSEPAPTVSSEPEESEPFEISPLTLWPLGIVLAGGGLFALYLLDPGMKQFYDNAVKDSSTFGIGNEDQMKASGGYAAPYYEMDQATRMAMGTKAIKAKSGKK